VREWVRYPLYHRRNDGTIKVVGRIRWESIMVYAEVLAETETHFIVQTLGDDGRPDGYSVHSKPYGFEVAWAASYQRAKEIMFSKV